MKIKIKPAEFSKLFAIATAVAPKRHARSIVENVKIEASEGGCLVSATDMEISVVLECEDTVEVVKTGETVVPVGKLSAIIRECQVDEIVLESKGDGISVKAGGSKFKLSTQNPDEFPSFVGFDEPDFFEISGDNLKSLIHRTIFATNPDSVRYALGGVRFEFAKIATAVGTDGRRLAVAVAESAVEKVGKPKKHGNLIVPTRALQVIDRIVSESDTVMIAPRKNDLLIKTDRFVFSTRLVEGRFPEYQRVIPDLKEFKSIDIVADLMLSCVRQAAIVTSDESRGVKMRFADGGLTFRTAAAEVGESTIEMPIVWDYDEAETTIDYRLLADALKVLGDNATVHVKDAGSQLMMQSSGFKYVVMPISSC